MKNFYFLIILITSFCANAQQLTSVVVINQLPNCINNTGTLEVTAIGGVPPYNYSINPNINGSGSQTSTTFPNLVPGNYIITTTDSVNDSVNVTVTLVPPPQLLLTVNNASTSDSVFVNAIGGTPPYQYSVDNSPNVSSNIFFNLSVGNHVFYVIDSNNCLVSSPFIVLATALGLTFSLSPISCNGNTDGMITVNPTGGLEPYTYSLNGGTSAPNQFFTGLTSGVYNIALSDALNFSYTFSCVITEPTLLISTTNILNSEIIVNATGGNPPYQYSVNSGALQSSNTFTGLPVGNYTVQTLDNNGCAFNIDTVINVAPPIVNNNQSATTVNFPTSGSTLADITVQGSNVLWYANPGTNNLLNRRYRSSDTPLPPTTIVQNNTTYYASQTINGFESQQRLAVTVTIGTVLSTNEIVFEGFKYYPNPIKNSFMVSNNSFEIQEINVLDLSGKLLISKNINAFKSEIDFSSLTNGMYFVKIKSQDLEKTIKVFKQ